MFGKKELQRELEQKEQQIQELNQIGRAHV